MYKNIYLKPFSGETIKQRNPMWISTKKLDVANGLASHPKADKILKQVIKRIEEQRRVVSYQPKRSRQNRRKSRQVGGSR